MAAGARDISAERRAGGRNTLSAAIRLDARRCMLAGEASPPKQWRRRRRSAALRHAARFFAENIFGTGRLAGKTVIDSADAVNGADAVLLA